jgi:hypothetical protein
MDILIDLIVTLSKWTRSHLSDISLAIMATALVLFGPAINAWVRSSISHFNFVIRTLIFVLVCALGYGLSIIYITPLLTGAFSHLNNYTLAPVLLMIFILIGILADRN